MKFKEQILALFIFLIIGYFSVAVITFRFRHPWATETETLLNIFTALKFDKVEYAEMRPRE